MSVLENKTNLSVFDDVNAKFGDRLLLRCPILAKFKIRCISIDEYIQTKGSYQIEIDNVEEQVFSCLIEKTETDASSTCAIIVVNGGLLSLFEFTINEQISMIIHEIGHIMFFFKDDKSDDQLCEELYADRIPCEMELQEYLYSALSKLYESDLYEIGIKKQLLTRMRSINVLFR